MWKVVISQEYEYSYSDGAISTGTHESTYQFDDFMKAATFSECAIQHGTAKTTAYITKGEENGI